MQRLPSWLLILALGVGPAPAQDDPAPAEETTPRAAPTAESACRELLERLQAGEAVALWEFLPPRWQQDVQTLVRDYASRVDPLLHAEAAQLCRRVVALVEQKRELLLGGELLGRSMQGEDATYEAGLGLLRCLVQSDLADARLLADFDGRAFCAGTGNELLQHLLALSSARGGGGAEALADMTVRTVRVLPQRTTLLFQAKDRPPSTEDYVQVEGRWVPAELARQWPRQLQQAQRWLQQLPSGRDKKATAKARTLLQQLGRALAVVEQAGTQAAFDQACAQLLQQLQGRPQPAGSGR